MSHAPLPKDQVRKYPIKGYLLEEDYKRVLKEAKRLKMSLSSYLVFLIKGNLS